MSDVRVPFGDNAQETATLLLAAAEEHEDYNSDSVRVEHGVGPGQFVVDKDLAEAAGVDYEEDDPDDLVAAEQSEGSSLEKKQEVTEHAQDVVEPDEAQEPREVTGKAEPASPRRTRAKKSSDNSDDEK